MTINSYNQNAIALARKFNNIGVRSKDIYESFVLVQKKNPFVLEIGCANGREAKEIIKFTNQYIGINVSKELIRIARQNVKKGRLVVADIEYYNFPKNLDVIFSFASLIHTNRNKLKKVFNRAHNSLCKGGIIYLSMKYGRYRELTKKDEFGIRTYYYYTPTEILRLTKGKYKTIKIDKQFFLKQKWFTIVLQKI